MEVALLPDTGLSSNSCLIKPWIKRCGVCGAQPLVSTSVCQALAHPPATSSGTPSLNWPLFKQVTCLNVHLCRRHEGEYYLESDAGCVFTAGCRDPQRNMCPQLHKKQIWHATQRWDLCLEQLVVLANACLVSSPTLVKEKNAATSQSLFLWELPGLSPTQDKTQNWTTEGRSQLNEFVILFFAAPRMHSRRLQTPVLTENKPVISTTMSK